MANSVENAQNVGRILGCLYPEYIDQDQAICYYFDNFYHLTEEGVQTIIENGMDGVRNWDAEGSELTSWTTADTEGYDEPAFNNLLDEGMAYLGDNSSSLPDDLTPSDNYDAQAA